MPHRMLVIFLLLAAVARAEGPPMIEVGLAPIDELPALTSEAGNAAAERWVRENGTRLPVVTSGVPRAASRGDSGVSLELINRALRFISEFDGRDQGLFHGDFRAEFVNALSDEWPGFAWVLVADRLSVETLGIVTERAGGAFGLQIPILGTRAVNLASGEGNLYLRLMPIGGNLERVVSRDADGGDVDHPSSGIVIRPMAELGGAYSIGDAVVPGFKFLIQPRLDGPRDYRLIAEVYVKIGLDFEGKAIRRVSLVPRCLLDLSRGNDPDLDGLDLFRGALSRNAFRIAASHTTCAINMEMAFGF
jgi:hypothetical protein